MTRRLPLFVLLAGAVTFLASLYLTWVAADSTATGNSTQGLLKLFSAFSSDGWGPFGEAAAVLAVALVAGAGVSLLRPQLARRLPLAGVAFALVFFAFANAAERHGSALLQSAFDHLRIHLGTGTYVGVASAAIVLLAAVDARRDQLVRRPSLTEVVAAGLTLGLLAAFPLSWLNVHVPHPESAAATGFFVSDLDAGSVVFIGVLACFGLPLWRRAAPPGRRLVVTAGLAVLTCAYLTPLGIHHHWAYERWLALGCALGLLGLALATARGLPVSVPPVADAAALVAACLLLGSLFLPWQRDCRQGACFSTSGWSTVIYSATAGGLTVILIVFLLGFRRLVAELAVAVAIYVMATGSELTQYSRLGYAAPLGFAGAALLLLLAARQLRRVPIARNRVFRLVPMSACLAFLAIPVAALTGRLSPHLEFDSPWRVYWLGVAAILVALRLLGRWLSGPGDDPELMFLPCALLALTALDLIVDQREVGTISWEGWASVVLCVVLLALGWIERNGGLERLRVPDEIWRIDRLPGES